MSNRVDKDYAVSMVADDLDARTRNLIKYGKTKYPCVSFIDEFSGGRKVKKAIVSEVLIENNALKKYRYLLDKHEYKLVYDAYTEKILCVGRRLSGSLARLIFCYVTRRPCELAEDRNYFKSVYFTDGFSVFYFEAGGKLFKVSNNHSVDNPLALSIKAPTNLCVYRMVSLDEIQLYLHQLLLLLFNDDSRSFGRYVTSDIFVINHKEITSNKENENWTSICDYGKLVPVFGADAQPEKVEVISSAVNTYLGYLISKYNISEIAFSGTDVDIEFIKFALYNGIPERLNCTEEELLIYLIKYDAIPFATKKNGICVALGIDNI